MELLLLRWTNSSSFLSHFGLPHTTTLPFFSLSVWFSLPLPDLLIHCLSLPLCVWFSSEPPTGWSSVTSRRWDAVQKGGQRRQRRTFVRKSAFCVSVKNVLNETRLRTTADRQRYHLPTVWPDLAKFPHLSIILKGFGLFLNNYLVFKTHSYELPDDKIWFSARVIFL